MLDLAAAAWVLDRTKVLHQGLDGHGPPPRRRESRSSRVRPGQASEISCVAPEEQVQLRAFRIFAGCVVDEGLVERHAFQLPLGMLVEGAAPDEANTLSRHRVRKTVKM